MIVPSFDDWTWEVLSIDKKNNYVLQRARGAEGDVGVIGIPNIELCTFTYLKSGLLEIRDNDSLPEDAGHGVMGPGVRFHYKFLRHGYGLYDNQRGRVDYFGKPLPSFEDVYKTASKTHVKLKTVSDTSDFYCISDPYDKVIWDGVIYWVDPTEKDTLNKMSKNVGSEFSFEPVNDGTKIVAFSKGININGKEIEPYVLHHLNKYDKAFVVTGPKDSVFVKIGHHGVYHKANEEVTPRYVQPS